MAAESADLSATSQIPKSYIAVPGVAVVPGCRHEPAIRRDGDRLDTVNTPEIMQNVVLGIDELQRSFVDTHIEAAVAGCCELRTVRRRFGNQSRHVVVCRRRLLDPLRIVHLQRRKRSVE